MKVLEKGNYKIKDWKLEVECTGKDWEQKQKPCHSLLELEDGDIVKRIYNSQTCYGFICCECKCFTEVDAKLIPKEIKKHCLQIAAPGSDYYSKLSEEEKKISEVL